MTRPPILFPLFAPLTSLRGVGPQSAKTLARLLGVSERDGLLGDLLFHLPVGLIDRSRKVPLEALSEYQGERVVVEVEVIKHAPGFRGRGRRAPHRVEVADESGVMQLVFFHARGDYLQKRLPVGETRIISGTVEFFRELAQITHPDYVLTAQEAKAMPTMEPVYPLSAGLTLQTLGKIIRAGLETLPDLPEWDSETKDHFNFPAWKDAFLLAHYPKEKEDLSAQTPARRRLAYDELLANQLALALIRYWKEALPAQALPPSVSLRKKLLPLLGYELTAGQKEALATIDDDLAATKPMLRLLQGDVGSGKTITAFLAMLSAVEAGAQAAMMVPTEVLAQQHVATLTPWCEQIGVQLDVLTSRTRKQGQAARNALLENISTGKAQVLIGTHSLFQDDVQFHRLGLVVIDEQHKFGVHQRLLLSSKSMKSANVLTMTATPIPRTLSLTAYGNMDISSIKEKPVGRKEIKTSALPAAEINKITAALSKAIAGGEQAYWVSPFIDAKADTEKETKTPLLNATERFEFLSKTMDFPVGLVHGRQTNQERDSTLARFHAGEIKLLVATSLIEVGIDVPQATIMVIEQAERFGLAQLHQLRGRVGRSHAPSSCLLLYAEPLGKTARERLDALRKTNDGFLIAETDLKLRGFGELLGTRQSGDQGFRLTDLRSHKDLLEHASKRAAAIVKKNPRLEGEEGENLRLLLYLFRLDEVSHYIRSG